MMPIDPNTSAQDGRRTDRLLLLALLVLTLVVRGGVLALMPGGLAEDPDDYRGLAENLLRHGTFETERTPPAYRPPLYPLMLTGCAALGKYSGLAIGVLHLGMGLATVWLVFLLAQRWGLGRWPAAMAAALVACDPILLAQSTQVMTETPATLLAVLALIGLTSAGQHPSAGRAAAAGGWLALAALCRPALLLWTVAAGVVLSALARPWPLRLKVLAGFTLAAVLVLSPWAIRNQLRLGRPIVTTTHGGYTLLLGNNPEFYEYLRTGAWGSAWKAEAFSETWRNRALADELGANRRAYAEAWENVRREPAMFLYSCLARIGRLWGPLPHQIDADEGQRVPVAAGTDGQGTDPRLVPKHGRVGPPLRLRGRQAAPGTRGARYGVGLWYLAELPLAAFGVWAAVRRGGYQQWLWGLLLAGCLTAVHTLYWSDLRMRAPLMPVVALAAATGLAWGGKALAGVRARPNQPGRRTPDGP